MQRRGRIQVVLLAAIAVLAAGVVVLLAVALPRTTTSPAPTATTIDWTQVQPGADASWPVCTPPSGTKTTMPLAVAPAFVIVGVNDGLPGTVSTCIDRELAWAATATGGSSQPRLAYYVMAADPWTAAERRWVKHPSWPASNTVAGVDVQVPAAFASTAHGTMCAGGHAERACAYVYGWMMARYAAAIPGVEGPGTHRFWIDVESQRDWSSDQLFNQAVVEGMVASFTLPSGGIGASTGIYSDPSEWASIIGDLRTGSTIDRLDEWLAIGTATKTEAVDALLEDLPLTVHGRVRMVQWLDGRYDRDIARPAR